MEDGDDDFGDLYADVEVQASSAMNVASQFSQLQRVSNEIGKQDCVVSDKEVPASGGVNDEDDDDEDDDFDIVLNSDDDNARQGEGYTIARNNTNLRIRELDDEDNDNFGAEDFTGGKLLSNSHSLYKYLRSQSAAYGDFKGNGCVPSAYLSQEGDIGYYHQLGSRSMVLPSGQRFSLPRSRNILDVNIDIFEQKPWKHPGADITDYFNFGFTEDSWKLYCNQVDEYRHRVSAFEPVYLMETKGYEDRFEHEIVAHDMWGESESRQRKGQAIQVEDSIVERQSSMDVRRHLNRDSDVIQVAIVDSSVPEASNHGGVNGDDCTDHLSFSSETEDQSVEGNHLEMDIYSSKRSSSSKSVLSGSENHEIHQTSDGPGGTNEAIKTSRNTKEIAGEDTCSTESFEEKKSPKSHITRKACENRYHDRQTGPFYKNRNHKDSRHKCHDDDDDRRKGGDHRCHARFDRPVYNSRTHRYFKVKPHYEIDFKPHEHKYHSRHSNDIYNQRTCRVPKDKVNREYDDSDIQGMHDLHSTFGHKKRYERLHAFDPYYEENISYVKSKSPSDFYGERLAGYEDCDTLEMDHHHRGYERYGAKMDQYREQRRYIEDNRLMKRDWFLNEMDYNQCSRNKGEDDEFHLEREYTDDMREEKFGSFAYGGGEIDDFKVGYGKQVENTRCKFRGLGGNSPSSESYKQSFASRSSEESHINNVRWHDDISPRNRLYVRHGRFRGYDGSLDDYSEVFDREDYIIDIDRCLDMGSKKHHWRSQMKWEDEVIWRHEDAKHCPDRTIPFEKISRHKRLIDHLHVKGGKNKLRRERTGVDITDSHLGCRNSHLVIGEVKSSEKRKKPKLMHSCVSDKIAQAVETKAIDDTLDIEEGQIVTEKVKARPLKDDVNKSGNQNRKRVEKTRILEAMAKMEKRRARFNEPIVTTKKDADCMMKLTVVESVEEMDLNKQQRPARKRRWGGN